MAQASGSEYTTIQKAGGVFFSGLGPFLYGAAAATVVSLLVILFWQWQLDLMTTFVFPVGIGFIVSTVWLIYKYVLDS